MITGYSSYYKHGMDNNQNNFHPGNISTSYLHIYHVHAYVIFTYDYPHNYHRWDQYENEINNKTRNRQRGPSICHFVLESDIKTYRFLPSLLTYEVSRLRTVWVITLKESLDSRKTDRRTKWLFIVGLPHLWWWDPNSIVMKYIKEELLSPDHGHLVYTVSYQFE